MNIPYPQILNTNVYMPPVPTDEELPQAPSANFEKLRMLVAEMGADHIDLCAELEHLYDFIYDFVYQGIPIEELKERAITILSINGRMG